MDKKEKRSFPRISVNFPVKISPSFLAEGIDISETGLSFVLEKPLLLTKAKGEIEISPQEKIDAQFKVIWSKQMVDDGKFKYGVAFIRFKEKELSVLRFILIQNYIKPLLEKINDRDKKKAIENFWYKDFFEFLTTISKIATVVEKATSVDQSIYEKLSETNRRMLQAGDRLESFLDDRRLTKHIKKTVRELGGPWTYRGEIIKHAYLKPRGYPGDYALLEKIYNKQPISYGIGYYCDRCFWEDEYARAVRSRKDKMKGLLIDFLREKRLSSVEILNIACGSSREIIEALASKDCVLGKAKFTMVDQDEEALNFSKEAMKKFTRKEECEFLKHNVFDYIKNPEKYLGVLGAKDLIYSIGLADYLPERVLKKLILFWFSLLKPKGRLIIAHKDSKAYKPLAPSWWCDWTFYPRSEKEVIDIITNNGIKNFSFKTEREPTNIIFFTTIEKG